MKKSSIIKSTILILLLLAVVLCQIGFDVTKPIIATGASAPPSPGFIHAVDMGFHAGVGSFLWAGTMPEILDALFNGKMEYLADENYVNAIDPKLSYPYAFTVLVLPSVANYKDRISDALRVGNAGIHSADPDWRIPYYMAADYFLELKDDKNALWYYNLAAHMQGIPDYALRFSLNFGIRSNERQKTEDLWATIRDSSNDEDTKQRAQAYIDRLKIFDYLDAASKIYQTKYGRVPTSTAALMASSIIPAVPEDPFGFTFIFNKDGTSGINTTSSFNASVPQ